MSNPILNDNFGREQSGDRVIVGQTMTVNGTLDKTFLMFLCAAFPALYTWQQYMAGFTDKAGMLMTVGAIAGFVMALIVAFSKNKFFVPLYAVCEGLFLGGISAVFNSAYPGIVIQAVLATFAAMFSMLALYRLKIIQCTDKFRMVIYNSTLAIFLLYMIQLVLGFFHISIPFIFSNSLIGIGFSLFVVAIATFNLIVDFDNIERFSGHVDKHMEWYFGFSLLVTIIWMYIEILHLLMKLQSRD